MIIKKIPQHRKKKCANFTKMVKVGLVKLKKSQINKEKFVHSAILKTYKRFEMYGNKEGSCKNKNCANLHLNLCKIFMRHNSCKYKKEC